MVFHPTEYFDLDNFAYKSLFEGNIVWEALDALPFFFEGFPCGVVDEKWFPGVFFKNRSQIFVGEGVEIEPTAYIQGPCILGAGTKVRHGAYIRGFVVCGEGCVIGHATEVKSSIFLNEAAAAHFAYVGDSILGAKVNLGAGVKCANLRLDHKEVYVQGAEGKKIGSGRKKLGAIIGDGAQVGCNAVLNPGVLVEKMAQVLPCKSVKGYVACQVLC